MRYIRTLIWYLMYLSGLTMAVGTLGAAFFTAYQVYDATKHLF